jgi:hypothetical protein
VKAEAADRILQERVVAFARRRETGVYFDQK